MWAARGHRASFSIPLLFRFLDGTGEVQSCGPSIDPQFQVVEAVFTENFADVRIAVAGDPGEDPMISVLSAKEGPLFAEPTCTVRKHFVRITSEVTNGGFVFRALFCNRG